jgi:hypothetical protein
VTGDPYAVILDQARARVAAGRDPDWSVLEARIRGVREARRTEGGSAAEEQALQQLRALASVHRARARVAPKLAPTPDPAGVRHRSILRDRPTITGTMEVRRERDGDTFLLRWEAARDVARWELRISERSGARGQYEVRDERELPGDATSVALPLGDVALRVHLIGRDRRGKLVRRAVMSSLTPESWGERWQRRASAA